MFLGIILLWLLVDSGVTDGSGGPAMRGESVAYKRPEDSGNGH